MTKKALSILMAATLLLSLIACSSNKDSSSSSASSPSSPASSSSASDNKTGDGEESGPYVPMKETVTFTKGIVAPNGSEKFPAGDDMENNDYTRYVEQQLNVKTKVAWAVAPNNFDQKVSLSIASKDIPDMMIVNRTVFQQLVENDLIWDLTEVYEKNVSDDIRAMLDSYGPRLMEQVTVNGKMMAIPGTAIGGQHNVIWVRKDWLEKLNLEVPKTIEEIEAVAKAFVEQDPGGNGKGKTVGLPILDTVVGDYNQQYGANTIFSLYDAWPRRWIEKDGNVVYGSVQPEMKAALEKLREMYADGIIDKEFAVRKADDRNAMLINGQAGMAFLPWYGGPFITDSVKNNKDADWAIVSAPLDANGKLNVFSQDPVNGFLVISKKFEHPEAIIRAMNVSYDASSGRSKRGEEIYNSILKSSPGMVWGVNPVPLQFDFENATEIFYNDLQGAIQKGSAEGYSLAVQNAYKAVQAQVTNPKEDPSMWREALMRTDGTKASAIEPKNIKNVAFYGRTETMTQKWANLEKVELDMMLKIIMGEKPIDEFDKFVNTWKSIGGDDITAEVQAAVKARK